jgi:hypothetical protein
VESDLIAGNGTYAPRPSLPADPVLHIDGSKFLIQQFDGEKERLHIDKHTQLHTYIDEDIVLNQRERSGRSETRAVDLPVIKQQRRRYEAGRSF